MAKKNDDLEDVQTFGWPTDDDDLPTQARETMVNNFEETNSKKKLVARDVADRIANNQDEDDYEDSNSKAIIVWGVLAGVFVFALVVVADVFLSAM